jgi:CheY-like chemotaxis protein
MDLRALIVEDEPALQQFYLKVLEKNDYQVDLARDGRAAIDLLRAHPAPHLVLLDVRLPDMDGIGVLEYMAQDHTLQRTHVVVASAGKEYEQYIHLVPSSEFLLKPILPSQIMSIAQRIRDGQTA